MEAVGVEAPEMSYRLIGNRVLPFFVVLGMGVLFSVAIVLYAVRVHASAAALIESASKIHSTADADREIAKWRMQSGNQFWEESDHPGGDHDYNAQVENLLISRLRIVEPTEVTMGITMRGGKLRCVTIVMTTGRKPSTTSSVWIQEWFDVEGASLIHVNAKGRPWKAIVDLTSTVPDAQRQKTLRLNTRCFVKPGGCRSAEEILPNVWQLATAQL
jgi:hypothetical protein